MNETLECSEQSIPVARPSSIPVFPRCDFLVSGGQTATHVSLVEVCRPSSHNIFFVFLIMRAYQKSLRGNALTLETGGKENPLDVLSSQFKRFPNRAHHNAVAPGSRRPSVWLSEGKSMMNLRGSVFEQSVPGT